MMTDEEDTKTKIAELETKRKQLQVEQLSKIQADGADMGDEVGAFETKIGAIDTRIKALKTAAISAAPSLGHETNEIWQVVTGADDLRQEFQAMKIRTEEDWASLTEGDKTDDDTNSLEQQVQKMYARVLAVQAEVSALQDMHDKMDARASKLRAWLEKRQGTVMTMTNYSELFYERIGQYIDILMNFAVNVDAFRNLIRAALLNPKATDVHVKIDGLKQQCEEELQYLDNITETYLSTDYVPAKFARYREYLTAIIATIEQEQAQTQEDVEAFKTDLQAAGENEEAKLDTLFNHAPDVVVAKTVSALE